MYFQVVSKKTEETQTKKVQYLRLKPMCTPSPSSVHFRWWHDLTHKRAHTHRHQLKPYDGRQTLHILPTNTGHSVQNCTVVEACVSILWWRDGRPEHSPLVESWGESVCSSPLHGREVSAAERAPPSLPVSCLVSFICERPQHSAGTEQSLGTPAPARSDWRSSLRCHTSLWLPLRSQRPKEHQTHTQNSF